MKLRPFVSALAMAALLSACGPDGGSGPSPAPPTGGVPAPPPPPPTANCSLRDRQDWVSAQMTEWYLFPETLPANRTPTQSTVEDYLDYLTATARAQGRDRYFTYITSIAEENAFYASGSSAGFGIRLATDAAARRVIIAEAYEGAPALEAGIDRGTEILAIGTNASNMRNVSDIIAAEGSAGVSNALGPPDPGVTRVLRITNASGTRDVTVTKRDYEITPVSSRYGARIFDDGGRRVAYVNLRTFISTADPALRTAFAQFRAQGITDYIIDFRYNGGGLISIANLMGDLLGGNRQAPTVYSYTTFRPEKAVENDTRFFMPQPQSVAAARVAFIGTRSSASASELVINAFIPYLGNNMALVGTNTYGKPVGQIAIDRASCDDRLRVVAFATQNASRQGDYYSGLASFVPQSCQAPDDMTRPLGDPLEASTRQALDFLAGRSCTPITSAAPANARTAPQSRRELLSPERPSTVQREAPGSF
jgi:carboxyl-terminal processing protease